ncbi:substrate-binding periplasmic protein [Agarivorans sp. Z349TD_8]|uniref:substrate-binding periplasmic protein n=1 Tax=Agarivorans sp. Z349TD_8 TaxID=3421434 RepID=UPI003D7C5021
MRKVIWVVLLLTVANKTHAAQSSWQVGRSNKQYILSQAIMDMFIKASGVTSVNHYLPFARRLRSLELGSIDISAGLHKTKDREKSLYFLKPPYLDSSRHFFVLRKQELLPLARYKDLYALRVGVKLGASYFEPFDHDSKMTKVSLNDNSACLELLYRNRLDACIVGEVGRHFALNGKVWKGRFKLASFQGGNDTPVYIAISKRSSLYVEREQLDALLQGLTDSGEIRQVIDDFYQSRNIATPIDDEPSLE